MLAPQFQYVEAIKWSKFITHVLPTFVDLIVYMKQYIEQNANGISKTPCHYC